MDKTILIATLPLALGFVLYVLQTLGYQFILHRPGMALTFFGYALSQLGLLYDAFTTINR